MNPGRIWKTFAITGMVLVLNGLVFSIITIALEASAFGGAAIGCLGSGIPLLIVGLLQKKKLKEKLS